MPSVYDFHHIELDRVGRGKKRSSGDSPISQRSLASTPTHSRPASRRGSRCEDTKNRLFGPAESSPRRVKNLFQSKVFDTVDSANHVSKIAATKAISTYTPIRRNPITGEVSAIQQSPSRCNSVLLKKPIAVNNGTNSSSLPVTPTFNRNNITISSTNGTNNLSNSSIASSCLSINSNTSSSSPSQ